MEENYLKYILILLAGTVFTVILTLIIGAIILNSNAHGSIKLYCFACIIFSLISLINNLKSTTIIIKGQTSIDSDGKQIRFVFRLKKQWADYVNAIADIDNDNTLEAISSLENILKKHSGEEKILRLLIELLITKKENKTAYAYINELEKIDDLSSFELLQKACIQSFISLYNEAEISYRKVLKYDKNNQIAIHNLGYTLTELGKYEEARELLSKAIELDPEFIHAYSSLGYLYILEGKLEEGKLLLDKSFEAEPKNAYTCKAFGVYYKKQGDLAMEKYYFDKAIALDNTIDISIYTSELQN